MASAVAANLRRNGTLQSCERCRKTKIKCDHSIPRCVRCVAKSLECIYEPAHMTRRFRAARFGIQAGRVRTITRSQDGAEKQLLQPSSETLPAPPTPAPSGPIEITTPPFQTGGFVGPGSYRTGLTADETQTPLAMSGYCGTAASPCRTTTHTIDRKRLDVGLQITDFVLEHSVLVQNLMRHIYRVIRMPIVPHKLMLPAIESLFSTIRARVPLNDDEAKLHTVIRIFQSSYQPTQATRTTTVDQVCQLITGENLRWETIGNILAMASLCFIHIQGPDFTLLDPENRSKQELIQSFHGITDALTTLTTASPVVNELGVALKYNQLLLALYRFSDLSQNLYSILTELTAVIYATGLHQDSSLGWPNSVEYPSFIHQWRQRCFTAVYSIDKTIATTHGRPPLVHRNYCVLDAPLDFDDDDLAGPELERELRKLDQHGWNTDGRRRTTTFIRLRYLLATVREEILELHLGVNNISDAPNRA